MQHHVAIIDLTEVRLRHIESVDVVVRVPLAHREIIHVISVRLRYDPFDPPHPMAVQ